MKKISVIVLAVALAAALTACNDDGGNGGTVKEYKDGKFEITGVTSKYEALADKILASYKANIETWTSGETIKLKYDSLDSITLILGTESKNTVNGNVLEIEIDAEYWLENINSEYFDSAVQQAIQDGLAAVSVP